MVFVANENYWTTGRPTLPTLFLVLGQECDWSGANCTSETAAICSSTGWDYGWDARGTTGTNKFGLEGSPTTRWTPPLRTLTTTGKSEALRTWSAASRVCSRAMMWSRLAAVPASSSESSTNPGVMDSGLRRWAHPRKMHGTGQRIGNSARASHGCSEYRESHRQRIVQRLTMTNRAKELLGSSTAARRVRCAALQFRISPSVQERGQTRTKAAAPGCLVSVSRITMVAMRTLTDRPLPVAMTKSSACGCCSSSTSLSRGHSLAHPQSRVASRLPWTSVC